MYGEPASLALQAGPKEGFSGRQGQDSFAAEILTFVCACSSGGGIHLDAKVLVLTPSFHFRPQCNSGTPQGDSGRAMGHDEVPLTKCSPHLARRLTCVCHMSPGLTATATLGSSYTALPKGI